MAAQQKGGHDLVCVIYLSHTLKDAMSSIRPSFRKKSPLVNGSTVNGPRPPVTPISTRGLSELPATPQRTAVPLPPMGVPNDEPNTPVSEGKTQPTRAPRRLTDPENQQHKGKKTRVVHFELLTVKKPGEATGLRTVTPDKVVTGSDTPASHSPLNSAKSIRQKFAFSPPEKSPTTDKPKREKKSESQETKKENLGQNFSGTTPKPPPKPSKKSTPESKKENPLELVLPNIRYDKKPHYALNKTFGAKAYRYVTGYGRGADDVENSPSNKPPREARTTDTSEKFRILDPLVTMDALKNSSVPLRKAQSLLDHIKFIVKKKKNWKSNPIFKNLNIEEMALWNRIKEEVENFTKSPKLDDSQKTQWINLSEKYRFLKIIDEMRKRNYVAIDLNLNLQTESLATDRESLEKEILAHLNVSKDESDDFLYASLCLKIMDIRRERRAGSSEFSPILLEIKKTFDLIKKPISNPLKSLNEIATGLLAKEKGKLANKSSTKETSELRGVIVDVMDED